MANSIPHGSHAMCTPHKLPYAPLTIHDHAMSHHDEYLKYSFYPYDLVSFSSVFMLNKCPNALKVHTYGQVIHLVELCKIGGKTATEAIGEATVF